MDNIIKSFNIFILNENIYNVDVYNTAVKYLISKYGSEKALTSKSLDLLRHAGNKKRRNELLNSFTDSNYTSYIKANLIEDHEHDDYGLYLLVKQYNISSTTIKPELYNKLIQMKII